MGGDNKLLPILLSPHSFAIMGAVSSNLAALPHFSGNQGGCRVGKPKVPAAGFLL